MRQLILLATAAAAIAASGGSAFAQSVGLEVYTGPRYDSYYYDRYERRPGPRVYGYYQDDSVVVERGVVSRPSSCGQFRYWDGSRCADARINPPNLN